MRRLCGEGSRSYLGRSRLAPERATVVNRSEKSAEAVVAAGAGRRAEREGEPTAMSLGSARHQKPARAGRHAEGGGEAEPEARRDEARTARCGEEGSGRGGLLAQALASANMAAAWRRVKANRGSAGVDGGVVMQRYEGTPQGGPLTPWTQKITSSSSGGSGCGVRWRFLICVVNSNTLMAHVTILRRREGATPERRVRVAEPGPQSGRGGRRPVRALCPVATSGIPVPCRRQAVEVAGGRGRSDCSNHDQGAGARRREVACACTRERPDDGRDRGARNQRASGSNQAPWLRAVGAALTFDSSSFLIVWGPARWSRPTPFWCRHACARLGLGARR
jgi:hypothetical protein